MIAEIWKDIDGYSGKYRVSNLGRILSVSANRILKPNSDGRGYLRIRLFKDGKIRTISIHVIVAEHFICKKPIGKEINHKDSNRSNNKSENLEWLTRSENVIHSFRFGNKRSQLKGMSGEKNYQSKLTNAQVVEIRKLYESGTYLQKELAVKYNVSPRCISSVISKDRYSCVI